MYLTRLIYGMPNEYQMHKKKTDYRNIFTSQYTMLEYNSSWLPDSHVP